MSHLSQVIGEPVEADPLRVVHVIKGLGPGGAERLIVNQLATSGGGIEYTVLRQIDAKDHLVAEVRRTGASTLTIGGGRLWPLALAKRLRTLSPDVIHVHSPVLAAACRVIVKLARLDAILVTTEHNRWPRHHPATRFLNQLTASLDDERIAVSQDVKESMTDRLHSSTIVLDHGVPVELLAQRSSHRDRLRQELVPGATDSTVVVGIVANFRPEKAYPVFLAAAERAIGQNPQLRFLVVGQGPGEAEFRRQVSEAGLSESINILGYRDDVPDVMSAFDIFTLSSRHEGKPVSVMEAFALGLPVVATRAGGIPEAVTHEVDGLLVDVGDSAGLATAWQRLASDSALRMQLAQAAAESALRFDASASTKSIESMYRGLSAG